MSSNTQQTASCMAHILYTYIVTVRIYSTPDPKKLSLLVYISAFSPSPPLFSLCPGERWVVGVGEGVKEVDSLRRELVHKLVIAPISHSQILKEFRVH